MIPRGRPSYTLGDLRAAIRCQPDEVQQFEQQLANYFGCRHAITFPYGRSAIHALLKTWAEPGSNVIQPAYNCAVVAHATIAADCQPVFIDCAPRHPNQDPEKMAAAVDSQTSVVIPTSIFGLSFDASKLCEQIRKRNPQALILMDCCQCFDSRWQGQLLARQGDAAVLAFGIGKPMTTLFGGALLTDRDDLANALRRYQQQHFLPACRTEIAKRYTYFLASWIALSNPMVGITHWLEQSKTPLRRYLLRMRSREQITLPGNNQNLMMPMEAAVGRQQLQRVHEFIARRRWIGDYYAQQLNSSGLELLAWGNQSSQAIYAARLKHASDRPAFLNQLQHAGIQGGTILDYVVPNLSCYRKLGFDGATFPNAMDWSQRVINLPNHPSLSDAQVTRIANAAQTGAKQCPTNSTSTTN